MGVQRAGNAGKEGSQGEGEYLVAEHRDTRGLGGDGVFTDRDNSAAMAGATQGEHGGDDQHHDDVDIVKVGQLGDAGQTLGRAGNGQVGDDYANDLAKA